MHGRLKIFYSSKVDFSVVFYNIVLTILARCVLINCCRGDIALFVGLIFVHDFADQFVLVNVF